MSMSEQEIFQAILSRARTELNPKIRVVPKREVWIHSVINKIMNLVYPASQKDRYLAFHTTLGNEIAMNDEAGKTSKDFGNWEVLCHEIKHTLQAMKWTRVLFSSLYLFPISLAILLILTAWTPLLWVSGWKLALWIVPWVGVGALLLHPRWPDPWRTRWELQAYTISMYLYHRITGDIPASYIQFQLDQFTSLNYYIMEPNKEKMRRILTDNARLIMEGKHPVKDEAIVKIAEEVLAKAG
jgi:hypothetical protein